MLLTTLHSIGHMQMLSFDPLHITPEYGKETEIQCPSYQSVLSKENGVQKIINLVLLQFCSHSYCPPSPANPLIKILFPPEYKSRWAAWFGGRGMVLFSS